MQMIAASKLKRAQHAAIASRPYVTKLTELASHIVPAVVETQYSHPYLRPITAEHPATLYVVIAPDKGLCGGLVTTMIREVVARSKEEGACFISIGKKIEGPLAATGGTLLASFGFGTTLPSFQMIAPIVSIVNESFTSGRVQRVCVITTHFNSVFSQKLHVSQLLPVLLPEIDTETDLSSALFEPDKHALIPGILTRYIEMFMFQQLLESYASEQAARMIAMQNATNNAKDIVNELQLLYNKARQEKITKEILDISSAAVALQQ
jgi:F-type H+-transporting ATPase subunit gamma